MARQSVCSLAQAFVSSIMWPFTSGGDEMDAVKLTKAQFNMLRGIARGGVTDVHSRNVAALRQIGFVVVTDEAEQVLSLSKNGSAWLAANPRGGARASR